MVLCNSKYREIYWAIADRLVPGATVEEITRAATTQNCMGLESEEEAEAWVRWRLDQRKNLGASFELMLSDNLWVRLEDFALPNG